MLRTWGCFGLRNVKEGVAVLVMDLGSEADGLLEGGFTRACWSGAQS